MAVKKRGSGDRLLPPWPFAAAPPPDPSRISGSRPGLSQPGQPEQVMPRLPRRRSNRPHPADRLNRLPVPLFFSDSSITQSPFGYNHHCPGQRQTAGAAPFGTAPAVCLPFETAVRNAFCRGLRCFPYPSGPRPGHGSDRSGPSVDSQRPGSAGRRCRPWRPPPDPRRR